ncbi:MAG: DUF438 domain-containing protein [Spirochaetales bacterium]|nr:DUF438 domain-containing protein [Spirochaetales bacterium]
MSEYLHDGEAKQEKLKSIITSLHEGKSVDAVKKEFASLIKDVSPEEIAAMENSLIREGFPPVQIQRLCEVHVAVFDDRLKKYKNPRRMPGHPLHTYMEENRAAEKLLKSIAPLLKKIDKIKETGVEELKNRLEELKRINLHFTRKENQLFPKLEQAGFYGPTRVMWGKHDEIRTMFSETEKALQTGDTGAVGNTGKRLIAAIKKMIFMEEKILFPTALRKLTDSDWIDIRNEESEIGYAWIRPGNLWDTAIARQKRKRQPRKPTPEPAAGRAEAIHETFHLDEGDVRIDQINLLLKHLPVDVTFVDENDRVRYFSQGKDRIFPRSPAIIGRAVQNCHPPKSVHIVDRIIESFKKKEKDVAEFWLTINGRFIHIRYFALYDKADVYRGVIEVSQDVTDIRALEGERRLLDW